MTTWDFLIALFYQVDAQMRVMPKHPEAPLWPSEMSLTQSLGTILMPFGTHPSFLGKLPHLHHTIRRCVGVRCARQQREKIRWKRNRFMCYDSVAERCSCLSGKSKEGSRWDTSHKSH